MTRCWAGDNAGGRGVPLPAAPWRLRAEVPRTGAGRGRNRALACPGRRRATPPSEESAAAYPAPASEPALRARRPSLGDSPPCRGMRLSTAQALMCPAGGMAGETPIPKDPAAKGQRRTASPQAGKVRPAAGGKPLTCSSAPSHSAKRKRACARPTISVSGWRSRAKRGEASPLDAKLGLFRHTGLFLSKTNRE